MLAIQVLFFPLPTILLTLVVAVETAEISTLFPQFFSEPDGLKVANWLEMKFREVSVSLPPKFRAEI